MTRRTFAAAVAAAALLVPMRGALADGDPYAQTLAMFRKSPQTAQFFASAHGYAVFPTIGKGGAIVGGAFGRGRVHEQGRWIGNVSMTQLSLGFQLGGQGFSQIVFFEDADALKRFVAADHEFGAEISAVAVTLGANARAGSTGATAGASVDKETVRSVAAYNQGVAVFTHVKGGLMYEVSVSGQKFRFEPRARK